MTKHRQKDIYQPPSSDLYDSSDINKQIEIIGLETKRLKKNNIISATLFVASGAILYYICGTIIRLIFNAGIVYKVPSDDIHTAITPYFNISFCLIPYVLAGFVAYVSFILGKIMAGIYLSLISIIMLIAILFIKFEHFIARDLVSLLLLTPLLIIALNSVRVNYKNAKFLKLYKNPQN